LGRVDELGRIGPSGRISRVDILAVEGVVRYYKDDRSGAVTVLEEVVQRGRRGEPAQLLIPALVTLAEAAFHLGRWDDASMHAELAVSLATDTDAFAALVQARAAATEIQAARGQFDEAEAHLEAARALVPAMPAWPVHLRIAVASASLAIARDDLDALQAAAHELTTGWMGEQLHELAWWRWRVIVADAQLAVGHLDDAAVMIERLVDVVTGHGYSAAASDVARLRGLLAEAQGRSDAAESAYRLDPVTNPATQSPLSGARLAMALGNFLRSTGEHRLAIDELGRAHTTFVALGAEPYANRCAADLAACGERVPDRVGRLTVNLSPRQEAVALLVTEGHSNKEIASKLYISVKGVEYHLGQIFTRTGFTSRRDLARWIRDNRTR
ncbi:MAG: LuxR C-terminal-related transcriptional regulator, partial [Microthrixaceae bacterium]